MLAALLLAAGCTGSPAAAPTYHSPPAAPAPEPTPAFPRTATYWLDQDKLPPVDQLARYDLVVVDSEWANRVDHSVFTQLRALNPDVKLLAYVNLVDYPAQLGTPQYWSDRYALWQFTDSDVSTFPQQWRARTADGQPVSEWADTTMANLADTAPQVDGQTFDQHAASWIVDKVWSTGLWDGVFLDVWTDRIYGADRDSWDVDGDGADDPDSEIYGPGGPWERGLTRVEQLLRERMPDAILIGNGDRTFRDQLLDGRAFESFADPGADRDHEADLDKYVHASKDTAHRAPGYMMNIDLRRASAGSPDEFRNARFYLTATLLQDGFWAPMGADYGELEYYDEMDGGLGPGYLGRPAVPDPGSDRIDAAYADGLGTVAPGVVRRDFEHGIVLNNSGTAPAQVDLGGTFVKIAGKQDTATNDGSTVTSVTVGPRDGLVLLRAG